MNKTTLMLLMGLLLLGARAEAETESEAEAKAKAEVIACNTVLITISYKGVANEDELWSKVKTECVPFTRESVWARYKDLRTIATAKPQALLHRGGYAAPLVRVKK